jgi:tetratricopeptide (TPR) repeat protein
MSSANTPTIGPLDPRSATPLPLAPGEVVADRYEVLRLLGSGGSAHVYAARDRRIGDEIALKLLRDGHRSDIDVERTRREAEFARGANSPRLVRTFDLVEADGFVFLTMELVPGGSLRERLRREPLPIDEAIRLGIEILEALADLHRLDIVHRDLKPGNLLLTADGHVKLSDFGIARRWTDDESRLTVTGATLGTIDYLSPEQASGEDVDPRSDLYSFGVLLFEMLTGRVPFEASTKIGAIGMRLHRRAHDVRTLRPETPRWLAAVIARLLQTKREDRYASAEAALHDLRRRRVRMARPRLGFVAALLVTIAFGAWWWMRPSMTLATDGEWGLIATNGWGETLWTRPDTRATQAVFVRGGREIAAILGPSLDGVQEPGYSRTLTFLDARTGRVLRTRRLPSPMYSFPDHSDRFGVAQVLATDLNDDGYDEVVVTYGHAYYPWFAVLHDLRRNDSRLIFVASGHHRIQHTTDVDGDGVAELILSGTANRQGWYTGAAVVRVPFDLPAHEGAAYTPDLFESRQSRSLLWYALSRPGQLQLRDVTVDERRRVIRLHHVDGPPVDLTFDGFVRGSSSDLPTAARQAARERAYRHLREADRLTGSGLAGAAVEEAEAARVLASRAGDATLAEWSNRMKGVALIHAGRFDEASALFTTICAGSVAVADAAWDAGNAFHLVGELPRALEWYRRSTGREGLPAIGRLKYEALQGAVLALGEMGRWDEASEEINRFTAAYPNESGAAVWYRHYVAWRTTGTSSARYDPAQPTDPYRYWALESERASVSTIDRDLRIASETRRPLLAARAEALRRAGRLDEALQVAREAYQLLRASRRVSVLDRAHLDVAAERLARIAEEKGLGAEAERVRAEAASLRWHSNGMTR